MNAHRRLPHLLILLLAALPAAARAVETAAPRSPGSPVVAVNRLEQQNRTVDEAALITKRKAVQTLKVLLKTHRDTPNEPLIMMRLVETMNSCATIEYRVAHGMVLGHEDRIDLRAYHAMLKDASDLLEEFIRKYPTHPLLPRALYLRGKASSEIGNKAAAIQDWRFLMDHYSNTPEASLANFSLCDLMIDAKDYKNAIQYLNRLAADPNDKNYPLAVDRLAWVYYYLNDDTQAIQYLVKEIQYYQSRPVRTRGQALEREKALMNVPLFYASGLDKRNPSFPADGALPLFKSLKPGPDLGKMVIQYAYLMRTKGFDSELEKLKDTAPRAEMTRADIGELLVVVFENQLNKHRYVPLKQTADEISQFMTRAAASGDQTVSNKVKLILTNAAATLQDWIAQKKSSNVDLVEMAPTLISLYGMMLQLSNNDVMVQTKVRYNLAELGYQLKDYNASTINYHWVAAHGPTATKKDKDVVEEARMKAIASKNELLRSRNYYPKDLAAKPISSSPEPILPKEVGEWMEWVDQYPENGKYADQIEVYRFEVNRVIYALGQTDEAMKRLIAFAKTHPKSQYAIPSASLVIDTYVASQMWQKTHDMAVEFYGVDAWNGTPFHKRLAEIAGDAYFKLTELAYKNKDYSGAIKRADEYLKDYPDGKHRNDSLSIAANAALAQGDRRNAILYFGELRKDKGLNQDMLGTALLTNASIEEDEYDLPSAVRDYRKYLELPPQNRQMSQQETANLRKKVLLLSFVSGSPGEFHRTLESKAVCGPMRGQCEFYRMLEGFSQGKHGFSSEQARKALYHAKREPAPMRLLWATIALSNSHEFSSKDRFHLLGIVTSDWSKQEGLVQYALLPYLIDSVPRAIAAERRYIPTVARLRVNKSAIKRRAALMEQMENDVAKLTELPWAGIRASAVNELANLYADFSREIAALPAPKGIDAKDLPTYEATVNEIKAPFDKKRDDFRKKAFDIASGSGVDEAIFERISTRYFSENVEAARQLQKDYAAPTVRPLDLALLQSLEPPIDAPAGKAKDANVAQSIERSLNEAVQNQNWPRISFMISEARQKKLLSEPTLRAARGISLAVAGARAEGLTELSGASADMGKDQKAEALVALVANYLSTYGREKVQPLVKAYADEYGAKRGHLSEQDAVALAIAAKWSGADVSGSFGPDIVELSRKEKFEGRAPAEGEGTESGEVQ